MASSSSADDVQLTDLEVIQQFSLAVRGATAPRARVIAALESDLAYLTGARRAAPTKTPTKTPATKAASRVPATKAASRVPATKAASRVPAKKVPAKKTSRRA
ncbi:MAG: hypothetical protein QOG99_3576 [Frankiales bacterium]|nr:hypothetical protein [Frankiales bacterium]